MTKLKRTWTGRILARVTCEINVADHCNIACLDCDHAAPALPRRFADPAAVERDFGILARHYRAPQVKVMGGEPLLHPELLPLLAILRRSRVAKAIRLVTNGTLTERMTDEVWRSVDRVEVSVYPETGVDEGVLNHYRAQSERFGKRLIIRPYDRFTRTFAWQGSGDPATIRRIFAACLRATDWGCHSIYEGRIHRCSQCIYIPRLAPERPAVEEGLRIEDTRGFRQALHAYLSSPEPLWSCRYCLGTSGIEREHRLVTPKGWRDGHDQTGEGLLESGRMAPKAPF